MPIYEYTCSGCGQVIEALQKFSDPPLEACSHCGGRLEKMMSLNSFHLKGGGWYVTDYKGSPPSASSEAKPASSEAKPASSPIAAAAKAASGEAKPAAAKAS